jgi:hypothetical protein
VLVLCSHIQVRTLVVANTCKRAGTRQAGREERLEDPFPPTLCLLISLNFPQIMLFFNSRSQFFHTDNFLSRCLPPRFSQAVAEPSVLSLSHSPVAQATSKRSQVSLHNQSVRADGSSAAMTRMEVFFFGTSQQCRSGRRSQAPKRLPKITWARGRCHGPIRRRNYISRLQAILQEDRIGRVILLLAGTGVDTTTCRSRTLLMRAFNPRRRGRGMNAAPRSISPTRTCSRIPRFVLIRSVGMHARCVLSFFSVFVALTGAKSAFRNNTVFR